MTRSLRVLKISWSLVPRLAVSTTSWFTLITPASSIVTMMVLFSASGSGGGDPGGGGCGTAASNPVGVNGVITMKITSSTNRMSINGVMLISDLGPTFFLFLTIPLIRWTPCLLANLTVESLGQQADFVDTSGSEVINKFDDISVLGAKIAFQENSFVESACKQVGDS